MGYDSRRICSRCWPSAGARSDIYGSTLPVMDMSKEVATMSNTRGYRMVDLRPTALLGAITLAAVLATPQTLPAAAGAPASAAERAIAHALNRLAFGARPGDAERIARLGLPAWIDTQLQPQRITNDEIDQRLAALT